MARVEDRESKAESQVPSLDALCPAEVYRTVPAPNADARRTPAGDGLLIEIPVAPSGRRWAVMNWLVPLRNRRRLYLDPLGAEVFARCDGRRTVGDVITGFAEAHRLSFLESRAMVMTFIKSLMQRGAVAMALEDQNKPHRSDMFSPDTP